MIPASIERRIRTFEPGFSVKLFKAALITIVCLAFVVPICLVALPYIWLLNDMAVQPKGKAQSLHGTLLGESLVVERAPVEGTIPMGYFPYEYDQEDEEAVVRAGEGLVNPVTPTLEVLEEGRKLWTYYCKTCHGVEGDGNGPIVGPDLFPAPTSLHTDAAQKYPDGRIFHVITRGQNTMPSYRDKFDPDERWAIVHYVRALQRARNPKPEDLGK
jgi:mono/diheme cytochrome c family protein